MKTQPCSLILPALAVLLVGLMAAEAFSMLPRQPVTRHCITSNTLLKAGRDDESSSKDKPRNFFDDFKGMLSNFDDVVDDFVMKRMGAGEQWYGKRKYNPSGRVDGDYNGMGRSSHYAIEIARVRKEVLEERKKRRLEEEAVRKNN